MNTHQLSAVVIVKNEEQNIERCLRSLDWVQEILVYDSGSVDQTVAIAKKMGAKVIEGEWLGFGPTKHKATALAQSDWVLSVDADEEVSVELKNEIQQKWAHLNPEVGYRIPRLSFFLGRWIRYGGWYPDYQLRLFNKKYSQWNQATIHEKVESKHQENMSNVLKHYVFKNIQHQVETNNRYSGLQAQQMNRSGKKFSYFHFLTKPSVKFIECYFWKLGFLDGWAGYVIARSAAYSVFLKWAQLKEMQK